MINPIMYEEGRKLYIVTRTAAVYTNKEDAQVLADFLNDGGPRGYKPSIPPKNLTYQVKEIFPDCYSNKIKRGYQLYEVTVLRDGTKEATLAAFRWPPGPYGFKSRHFQLTITGDDYYEKMLLVRCLAENEEEALAIAEKERLKTLLDETWEVQKGMYRIHADKMRP